MKKITMSLIAPLLTLFLLSAFQSAGAQQLTATDIIKKADEKFNGEMSGYSVMSMTIVRPTWQRTVEIQIMVAGR